MLRHRRRATQAELEEGEGQMREAQRRLESEVEEGHHGMAIEDLGQENAAAEAVEVTRLFSYLQLKIAKRNFKLHNKHLGPCIRP